MLVRFAAYTGLRAGEIAALRVRNVDLRAGTVNVTESTAEVGGRLVTGRPKTERSVRVVGLPRFLVDELRAHLGDRLLQPDTY
ncbi:MAG: tyrosine-type recombinase/integrase, partial [Acidimicrobiia bacterium]|nr:tyrosine-type recombinase/integrase [Acidimicrobiia bacterium]